MLSSLFSSIFRLQSKRSPQAAAGRLRQTAAARIRTAAAVSSAFLLFLTAGMRVSLPQSISAYSDEKTVIAAVTLSPEGSEECGFGCVCTDYQAKLLGVIPVGSVRVNKVDRISLIPGGMSFGARIACDGVIAEGFFPVAGQLSPCLEAGMTAGDVITSFGSRASDASPLNSGSISDEVAQSGGKEIRVSFLRDGKPLETSVIPRLDADGSYRIGVKLRDYAAGIGTVTFVDPESLVFAGLGHGIYDADTGLLIPFAEGKSFPVSVTGLTRGEAGKPGEVKGHFSGSPSGELTANRDTGVYGAFSALPDELKDTNPIPIALRDEIHDGSVTVLTSPDGGEIKEYSASIKIGSGKDEPVKNFTVEITDPGLIELTGGIIQGMSGSPVIQDGRLIGAVTHVMIGDPKSGYGIFIENMLADMPPRAAFYEDEAA